LNRSWLRWFAPDETIQSADLLDLDSLKQLGVRAVLFDLDNTLQRKRLATLQSSAKRFLQGLVGRGFQVGIISNRRFLTSAQRAALSLEGFPARFHAGKPSRKAFDSMLLELGVQPGDAVFVGDRRLTDVWGARRAGLRPILIRKSLSPGLRVEPWEK